MGFFKKRIVLKHGSDDLSKGMAVLTIEQTNGGIFGNVKTYDLNAKNNLYLGVSCNGIEILNTPIYLTKDNLFNFKFDKKFEINGNIGVVIVEKYQNNVNALVWASNNASAEYKDNIIYYQEKEDNKNQDLRFESVEVYENKVNTDANKNNQKMKIETAEKEAKLFETSEEELEELINEEMDDADFYLLIKDQLDELFNKYPAFEKLTEVIPNSKWVKVDYENNGKEYVVGLIYENEKIKYICYGIPAHSGEQLPSELEEFAQWLPIEQQDDEFDGFYLMFQDASTGDSVNLDKEAK